MAEYPYASLRIELGPDRRLGPGKVRLLELIDTEGSISAAARQMGMSYRRAWLLVEESNRLFATPLVESAAGGPGGGGASLTALGRKAVKFYRAIERDAVQLIQHQLTKAAEFNDLEDSSEKS
jgi:molybdate transport system regulatory protein